MIVVEVAVVVVVVRVVVVVLMSLVVEMHKKTKKYLSLAGCQKLAEKKSKAAAFVLDNKEKKCIVLKSVTGWTKDPEVVSGSV